MRQFPLSNVAFTNWSVYTQVKRCVLALFILCSISSNAQTGGALNFTNGDYVELGSQFNSLTFGTGPFTLETWFKTSMTEGTILSKRSICNVSAFWNLRISAGKIRFEMMEAGGVNTVDFSTPLTYNDNTWHHVAVTRSTTLVQIFIDGYLVAANTQPGITNLNNTTDPVKIGQSACTNFVGELDETRIWTEAQTTCEIYANKNYQFNSTSSTLKFNAHYNQGTAGGSNTTVTSLTNSASNAIPGTLNTFALSGSSSNWVSSTCPAQGLSSGPFTLINVDACVSYTWAGTTYTSSGTYNHLFTTSAGCDSAVQMQLIIHPLTIPTINTISNSACLGSSGSMIVTNSSEPTYCTPTTTNTSTNTDYISSFQLNEINNMSGDGPGVYNYYPGQVAFLNAGGILNVYSYQISFGGSQPQGAAVWIDLNQDGDFSDAGELMDTYDPFLTNTTFFSIPGTALNGLTRLRVACRRSAIPGSNQSCGGYNYGEFEDYNVFISGGQSNPDPFTYSWSPTTFLNNSTIFNPTFSNITSPTIYTVTLTDANGCSATATKSITINPLPATPVISSPSNSICLGTTMKLSNSPNYCTPTVSGSNVSGQHYIQVFTLSSTTINNLTGEGPGVYNYYANLSGQVSVGSGYNFMIGHGGTSSTSKAIWIDLNQDGDFSDAGELVASAAASNTSFSSIFVIPPSAYNGLTRMRVAVSSAANITSGQSCSGFIQGEYEDYNLEISGGFNATTWAPSSPLNTSIGNPVQIVNQTSITTYTVTITDANGCTKTDTQTISVLPSPNVNINSSADSVCSGNSVTLLATGATSYSWSPFISNGLPFTPTATTTYTVTATAANGCTNTATKLVKVLPVPTTPAITGPGSICPGGNVLLTTSNYCTPVNQPSNTFSNQYSISQFIFGSPIVSNTFSYTYINNSINTNSVYSDFTDKVAVVTAGSPYGIYIGTPGTQALYYLVMIDYNQNGVFDVLNGEVLFQLLTASTSSQGINFTFPSNVLNGLTRMRILVSSHNFNADVACFNHDPNGPAQAYGEYEDYSLLINGGINSTLTWSPAQSLLNTQGANTIATINATTTYTVTNTGSNGCTSSSTKLVTTLPVPTVNITSSAPGVCLGNPVTLTASGASSYVWSNGVSNGVAFSPTSTSSYSVVGTNASGCKDTATISIPVDTAPTIPNIIGNNVCNGQQATLSLGGSGGSNTYVWAPSNLLINSTGSTITTVPLTTTTTFTVTATSTYGCTATATKTVTVNPLPAVTATSSGAGICPGDSVQLGATTVPAVVSSISWSPAQGLSNPTISNPKASPGTGTIYFVTVTDANGCTSITGVLVSVNGIPNNIIVNGPNAICTGSSATLTATGASSYNWQPGNLNGATITLSPTESTTYTVTASNSFGCTKTASKLVAVNPAPLPSLFPSSNSICTGTTVSLNSSMTTAVGPSLTIIDHAPANPYPASINVTGLPSSNNQLARVYINGLSHTFPADIDMWLKAPNGQIVMLMSDAGSGFSLLNHNLIFEDGKPALPQGQAITGVTYKPTNYEISGTNEPASPSTQLSFFNGNMNGVWELYVRDDALSDSGTIASFQLEFGNPDTTNLSIAWVANPAGNQSSISNPTSFNTTFTPLSSTIYTATVSDAIGCTATSSVSITVNPCNTNLSLKLFIEGYYSGAQTMTPVKMNEGIGNSTTDVDDITVELRNAIAPYGLVATTTAALKTNGTALVNFTNSYTGSYYVVVKHRNALETWSANPVLITTSTTYDFTTAANKAYGDNQISVGNGQYAIYSGDVNQDENVDLIDASMLETDINAFQFGYLGTDINGDGNVDLLDAPIVETNINGFIFSSHP